MEFEPKHSPEFEEDKEKRPEEFKELREVYSDSSLFKMLDGQSSETSKRAIFTDIDDTYYLEEKEDVSKDLTDNLKKENIPVVGVTGRNFKEVKERIQKGKLPDLPVIAGSLGTEIWVKQDTEEGLEYQKDNFYEGQLQETDFRRSEVESQCRDFIKTMNKQFPDIDMTFQEEEGQLPFKVGINFYSNEEQLESISRKIQESFSNQEVTVCRSTSQPNKTGGRETRIKYYVDISPATKIDAVEYIAKIADIEEGIVAGDSGNDIRMLLGSDNFYSVAVGGTKPQLTEELKSRIVAKEEGDRSFKKVEDKKGNIQSIYIENDKNRLGPESIARAAEILQRAESIKEENQEQNE